MVVQVVIVLISVAILTVMGGDLQVKPFYFDIGAVLYFIILMALIVGVESFFFTYLEQWHTKSISARSYMLKRSIRRSLMVMAVSAVVIFLVLTPFMADAIANSTSEAGTTHTSATFMSRDPLGLTSVDRVHVVSSSIAEVIILSHENYLRCAGNVDLMRQYAVATTVDASPGVDLEFPESAPCTAPSPRPSWPISPCSPLCSSGPTRPGWSSPPRSGASTPRQPPTSEWRSMLRWYGPRDLSGQPTPRRAGKG
jgi:hypothetical protein